MEFVGPNPNVYPCTIFDKYNRQLVNHEPSNKIQYKNECPDNKSGRRMRLKGTCKGRSIIGGASCQYCDSTLSNRIRRQVDIKKTIGEHTRHNVYTEYGEYESEYGEYESGYGYEDDDEDEDENENECKCVRDRARNDHDDQATQHANSKSEE